MLLQQAAAGCTALTTTAALWQPHAAAILAAAMADVYGSDAIADRVYGRDGRGGWRGWRRCKWRIRRRLLGSRARG